MNKLWEIQVPVKSNDGKTFSRSHHAAFDRFVIAECGGMTRLTQVQGSWLYEGKLFAEAMTPVRFVGDEADMDNISRFAMKHYNQLAVIVHLVSDRCLIMEAA